MSRPARPRERASRLRLGRRVPAPASALRSSSSPARLARAGRAAAGFAALGLALLLGAGATLAQTTVSLVSNTGQTRSTVTGFNSDNAQAFTAGSSSLGYKLTSVQLEMEVASGNDVEPTYTVSICSNTSCSTNLGTLTNPSSIPTGTATFTASGTGITLEKGKKYFVVVDVTGNPSNQYRIELTDSNGEDAGKADGWSIEDTRFRRPSTSSSWGTATARKLQMAIRGYAIVRGTATSARTNVDGSKVRVTFSNNPSAGGNADRWSVSVTGRSGKQPNVSSVSVSGAEAVLNLTFPHTPDASQPNANKPIQVGETMAVAYSTTTGTGAKLKDVHGLEIATFGLSVRNDVVAPPTVSSVAIVSDPGPDKTYALGDEILVKVTFSEEVTVTGTPTITVKMGAAGGPKDATYKSGESTATELVFGYTVKEPNGTPNGDGIGVPANTLAGGTIKSKASPRVATLTHAAVDFDSDHLVDWTLARDTTPPTLVSAAVDGATLTMTFSEKLDSGSLPAGDRFTVTDGDGDEEYGEGTASVAGAVVTVTLENAIHGFALDLKVAYDKPASGPLRDHAAGLPVASFSDKAVTNNAPPYTGATVNGKTLTITFGGALDASAAATPAANRFRYTRGGSPVEHSPTAVSVSGKTVTLTLRHTITRGEELQALGALHRAGERRAPGRGHVGQGGGGLRDRRGESQHGGQAAAAGEGGGDGGARHWVAHRCASS